MLGWAELLIAALSAIATAVALALRPWRGLPVSGPPVPWIVWCLLLPWLWSADRLLAVPFAQPLSGSALLLMAAGWPLAVLALGPVALATAWLAGLDAAEALQRAFWLGLLPATLALGLGAAIRRWLPNQPFVYILGRGFFGTLIATSAAAGLRTAWQGTPTGLAADELLLGRWLAAWTDAWLCGFVVAIFVAYRPHWLATYADRIYLKPDGSTR